MTSYLVLFLIGFASKANEPTIVVPAVGEGEYAIFDVNKYRKFKVFESEGLMLSADCQLKKMKCEAFEAANKKIDKIENPLRGVSPASQLCSTLDGKNLIAFNHKKDEYNFCQFEDKSLVNSWTLYYKFFPKPQKK